MSRIIFPGTLLLTNSGATLGVPKITHIQGCINDGVAAFLRMRPGVIHEYLYYYWSSQTKHLHAWVNLGAQPNLNTQIIGGWPVLLPTCDEQQQIADFLTSELAQIAFSSRRLSDEISLMQEYRTRLIADIVTGKLDVRESAAALPDDLEAVESDAEELLDSDETTDDAALVEIEEGFHILKGAADPYLVTKAEFLSHHIPVQEFEFETTEIPDKRLHYVLNNMGLATYAKLGGTPWLVRANLPIAHELVVGLGSASVGEGRLGVVHHLSGHLRSSQPLTFRGLATLPDTL